MPENLTRLANLRATLSEPRLSRYLAAFNDDIESAIECHHWNSRLAHELFLPIQLFEIALRNRMDNHLSAAFGSDWLVNQPEWLLDKENKKNRQRAKIEDAIYHIVIKQKKVANHGKIIAELPFSFWIHLLSRHYMESLWTPHLRHCFPNSSQSQKEVHYASERILILRNRISHHEPIIFKDGKIHLLEPYEMATMFDTITESIGWMCSDTQNFVNERSSFYSLHAGFSEFFLRLADLHKIAIQRQNWRRLGNLQIASGHLKFYNSREKYGYLTVENHQDVRIEEEAILSSGFVKIFPRQSFSITFEYVGKSAIARHIRSLNTKSPDLRLVRSG